MRTMESIPRKRVPRQAYKSQAALVAHRCVLKALESDPEAFRGCSAGAIENALQETLGLALVPPEKLPKDKAGSSSKSLNGTRGVIAEPPGGPEEVEKVVLGIGDVIASRFPWFWKKLMPCELDILEREITRVICDTLEVE
jgi:hypothetical protein